MIKSIFNIAFIGCTALMSFSAYADHSVNDSPYATKKVRSNKLEVLEKNAPKLKNKADSIDLNGKHLFLFSYFNDEGKGMFYAMSNNGVSWVELNHGQPIVTPKVGSQKLMRDPSINKGIDGTYHLVWTTGWNGKDIGHATSTDLVNWSEEDAIPVGKDIDNIEHCWAPEVFYNDISRNYMIFWSSNYGPAKSPKGEGRIYYVTTQDFKAFSTPKILFRNGFTTGGAAGNNGPIDAFILKDAAKKYILFYKKDDNTGVPTVFHRIGKSPIGPWGQEVGPIKPSTGDEGPSCIKIDGKYHLFTDPFESNYMYTFVSSDLKTWERKVTNLKMSHGTIIEISKTEAKKLLNHFNK
ncbi:glycoside hydrolase family 43 protein [Mucilaginibacter sp. SP1R1]|uniref:glycoside hydrolase family 43 protein n=1 Tax=Mucilaginibacter sp. SP1R1 TaxID=2723091 RepID=UPI0016214E4D|nr:glycoside hydrolase family 43 protein [Mucilaginibacter sp. SP1R1]MBB6148017.1 beta-galactosidase [Mucilaginibacter sp. SP1R1]